MFWYDCLLLIVRDARKVLLIVLSMLKFPMLQLLMVLVCPWSMLFVICYFKWIKWTSSNWNPCAIANQKPRYIDWLRLKSHKSRETDPIKELSANGFTSKILRGLSHVDKIIRTHELFCTVRIVHYSTNVHQVWIQQELTVLFVKFSDIVFYDKMGGAIHSVHLQYIYIYMTIATITPSMSHMAVANRLPHCYIYENSRYTLLEKTAGGVSLSKLHY